MILDASYNFHDLESVISLKDEMKKITGLGLEVREIVMYVLNE